MKIQKNKMLGGGGGEKATIKIQKKKKLGKKFFKKNKI